MLFKHQDSGIETKWTLLGRCEALRAEAWRAEPGPQILGEGLTPSSQAGGLQEHSKLPQWATVQSAGRQEIWCILGSSGELFCSPVMQYCVYV